MAVLLKISIRSASRFTRAAALMAALACTAIVTQAPHQAFAQEAQAVGTGEGDSSSTGIGGNTSANQSSNFSATASTTVGGDYSATGNASTDANAQQSTGGNTSTASAQTDTQAEADNLGGFFQAGATGSAGADGSVNGDVKEGDISASAFASAGATPQAEASTSLNGIQTTHATAAYQQPGSFSCLGGCTSGYSKQTGKKTVSVAMREDAFSLAVASKKSAYAKSGAINDFTKKEQKTITRSLSVGAYARANQKSARGVAFANAFSRTSQSKKNNEKYLGFTKANAFAKATACVGSNCGKGKGSAAAAVAGARSFTVVRDCDRQERKIGNFSFPVCEYKVVAH
jgi:hypothetical protein